MIYLSTFYIYPSLHHLSSHLTIISLYLSVCLSISPSPYLAIIYLLYLSIHHLSPYSLSSNAEDNEETEVERFYEGLQDLLGLTPKKDVLFIIRDWNAKVGDQETPRVTGKFGLEVQNEAGQRQIEFCQENALVIANILFNNTREDSTHGHHQMVQNQTDYILCSQRWRSSIQSAKTRLGADCGSDMNFLLPNSDLIEDSRENQ